MHSALKKIFMILKKELEETEAATTKADLSKVMKVCFIPYAFLIYVTSFSGSQTSKYYD